MRVCLYDQYDYEPITVIDVPIDFLRDIELCRRPPTLLFPVAGPFSPLPPKEMEVKPMNIPIVKVNFEPIMRGSKRIMWLCTTGDAETALLLRSAFLPGQVGEVHRREQEAFLSGFMAAMSS